jgi:hypothetical protein
VARRRRDRLQPGTIEVFAQRWLHRIPMPFDNRDRDGIERAFHEDGNRSPGERLPALVQAEQQAALLEAGGLGAVEVPGHAGGFAAGADAADEPGGLAVLVAHWEHDPVPEDVDERSPGGPLG